MVKLCKDPLNMQILYWYMKLFSKVGVKDLRWEGYTLFKNATSADKKDQALLSISKARYTECYRMPLDKYFKLDLKIDFEGKDVLEIGSNHGGATLAYYEQYGLRSITGIDTTDEQVHTTCIPGKCNDLTSEKPLYS